MIRPIGHVALVIAILASHAPRLQSSAAQVKQAAGPNDGNAGQKTILGLQDGRFTINGQPQFLLGFSYYGALGAPEDLIRKDLDDFAHHGFNWLRVWATWSAFDQNVSAVDAKGSLRELFLRKLQWLVAECDRRGFAVDVTLSRGKIAAGNLPDFAAHSKAVQTIVDALREHRNWYLDLANEHDVHDDRYVSNSELKQLRELARRLAPQLLVTASFGGHDLSENDVRQSLLDVGIDFLSPHRPRTAQSPAQTEARTREVLEMMRKFGRTAPALYQEPFRRGYGPWEPMTDDFLADLRGAIAGGAAGWCVHNGSQRNASESRPRRSFDLRAQRLWEQLDREELKVVEGSRAIIAEPNRQ